MNVGYLSRYSFKKENRRGDNRTEEVVSYLPFADEALIFCKDSKDQLVHLAWYKALRGLRINGEKQDLPCRQGGFGFYFGC